MENEFNPSPTTEPTNDYKLDPYHKRDSDFIKETFKQEEEAESIENIEAAKQAEEAEIEEKQKSLSYNVPILGKIKEVGDQAALGVGDFAFDAVGLVPWLKPAEEWWDKTTEQKSNHPAHKLVRDASSVILPSLIGGTWVVGGARAAVTARTALTLPKFAHTLGTVAAYTGVDTTVAMISSHSKTDDNMAATLNDWLGWNIPWATRTGDDPDTRWKKNVYEAAGMAGAVELLGAAFTFGRKAKLFPRDAGAEEIIAKQVEQLNLFEDPLSAAVEPTRSARKAAQMEEMVEAIKKDPSGESGYNAFINDIGEDTAGKAVVNAEANPLQAKLHQAQIQGNVGSLHGRPASVANESFVRTYSKYINGNERARQLDQLFDSISPNFDAVVSNGTQPVRITAEEMNRSIDNLTESIYGQDISFNEFQVIVDDMKSKVFNSNSFLDEDSWVAASNAFKEVYENIFDPNQMRASAMLAQQTADNVVDAAAAAKLLGDEVDTSRQLEIMFNKLTLLDNEIRVNDFITKKALEYKRLLKTGNSDAVISWMGRQSEQFDAQIKQIRVDSNKINDELLKIAKSDYRWFGPLKDAFFETDGKIDTLYKLKQVVNGNISVIKKGFIDGDPEFPSLLVRQLYAAKIGSLLSGLSPISTIIGNSALTFVKPIAVLAGAKTTGSEEVFKRAQYVFGGIGENFKRAFKVMQRDWNLATAFPEEAMMRGRTDLAAAKLGQLEYMESTARVWKEEGELGKLAFWNLTKAVTWWNKQPFVRYGTNALYAIDGMTNSFMASGMARGKAYDRLLKDANGSVDFEDFTKLQRQLYSEAFDETGKLTDDAARMASSEIALNLDNEVVSKFQQFLEHVPAAKSLFLFAKTGINGLDVALSFSPASALGPALTRARRALSAKSAAEKLAVLTEHGIDSTENAELAFQTLKSEYIGRQLMGSAVVMGVGLWAIEGNITGAGPANDAEKRRMMDMGWRPWSIKNPITGEWRSYQGFEPFDKVMGLTADIVYQTNRVDGSISEDSFRKVAHAISMNMTSSTFVSGFEPLVGLLSSDASAWTRFWAQQLDTTIPYKGVRSVLNNIISPQLLEVGNDFKSIIMNQNKFLFAGSDNLKDKLDIYTGKPIRYYEPLTRAANAVLPMFKSNGGMEPWRQWLLSTGWDGTQSIKIHPDTKQPLDSREKNWINNWIATYGNLAIQIADLMTKEDGFYQKKMKEYTELKGQQKQADFPIKQWIVHQELDKIHNTVFKNAIRAFRRYERENTIVGREIKNRDFYLKTGQGEKALEKQKRIRELLNY